MLANELVALWRYRDLLRHLVARDLHVKYKGSSLGFAWSLLHPLVLAGVYTLAFQYIVRIRIEHFPLFLLSGLLPWTFFASSLAAATASIVDNMTLVRKVAFPRAILPLGVVAAQFVQFLLMYTVVIPVALLTGVGVSPALAAVLPLALLQLLFALGLSLALATSYVYFRDTRHLVEVGLQIWFWLTPIIYSLSMVPPWLRRYVSLNPMAVFVVAYQDVVMRHALPGPATLGALLVLACGSALAGLLVFDRHQRRFAELV